jgi:hypothetical protein
MITLYLRVGFPPNAPSTTLISRVVCFAAIVPHECLFDYCGEQMALYCGKDFGDLITITLNK